jgi:hypothetical protein
MLFRRRHARDIPDAAENGKDIQLERALKHIREQIAKSAADEKVPSEKPEKEPPSN